MTNLPVYQTDLIERLYRPMAHGDWVLRQAGPVLTRGYWSPPQLVGSVTALLRGAETWMSITPLELESQEIGVAHTHGHVAIFGLGMGWSAAASALRPEVEAVTVVERDSDVLALNRDLDLFARLPNGLGRKVTVVRGDAFEWRPSDPVDVLMPDIWLSLVSDGRVEEVQRMQTNVGADEIYFWGQEMEIARHARAAGRELDAAGIRATAREFDLPLIGLDDAEYPARVQAAAAAWMRDRWLPPQAGHDETGSRDAVD